MKTHELKGSEDLLFVRKQLASCYSIAAQVINDSDLDKVAQIYLPSYTEEKLKAFLDLIGDDVVGIFPIAGGKRMYVFCKCLSDFNDEQNMLIYQVHLESIFANENGSMTQPYGVRIYEFAHYEEGI